MNLSSCYIVLGVFPDSVNIKIRLLQKSIVPLKVLEEPWGIINAF